ncbi:TIGR03086 family metal-binding protein [Nocardioides plantarum]|uniref:TIGR03086 family metal-binding protein n=1 Tax=Nocardioides plantarum TaxID=29299 RepID=A0ABV5KCA9_9ACTN|nr:TIGR03086 family metal-binding protein [Nocardioides plantarum]
MPDRTPGPGVELLERALGYTRSTLLHVRPEHLHRPTPCAAWSLDQLLDHMDDALGAFTEGATGAVDVTPPTRALEVRVATLLSRACGLLGAWSAPGVPGVVDVGGLPVPTAVVASAAALEIATHGWDVALATGRRTPIPADLARELLAVAVVLVDEDDRDVRFARPRPLPPYAGPAERLLAHLGRDPDPRGLTGPLPVDSLNRRTRERPAS